MEIEYKYDDRDLKELVKDFVYEFVEFVWIFLEICRCSYMFFYVWLNFKMVGFWVLNLFLERVNLLEDMDVLYDKILW